MNNRTFHPGQLVNIDNGTRDSAYVGFVVSSRDDNSKGFTQTFVTVQYRRDWIGADEQTERESYYVYPNARNSNRICTGRVGRGEAVHILHGSNPACGSGRCTTGAKKNHGITIDNRPVTCTKCLKELEQRPELAAEVRQHIYYINLAYFWTGLQRFIHETESLDITF